MHFPTPLTLLTLTLSTLACALPQASSSPDDGSTGTTETPPPPSNVAQLRSSNSLTQIPGPPLPPGPSALSLAFAKYGKTPIATAVNVANKKTSTSTNAATSTQQNTIVAATPGPNDIQYLVNMTVGKAQLTMNLDTGSSDFWVFSSKLSKAERGTHSVYKLGGTKVAGQTWDISYADGSYAEGVVYVDKAQIGGVRVGNVSVEAATDLSPRFTTGAPDGLVGLGFPDGNTCTPRCTPFFSSLAPTLSSPLITFALRKGAPGSITFGYIDPSLYTGSITYVSTNDNLGGGYWEFNAGGFSIGNGSKVARKMDTIADTGTSLLLADDAVVSAFYAPLPSQTYSAAYGAVIFNCSEAHLLPDLSYYIGGSKHTMPGAYGMYGQVTTPAGFCYGGVQSNSGLGFTILGDVWLKSQYAVFDYGKKRVGFAAQKGVEVASYR